MERLCFWLKDLILILLTCNFVVRKRIINHLARGSNFESVLDAGCGTGILARLFSSKQYYGVDVDRGAVSYARKANPGYKFAVGDLTNFTSNRSFDLVLVVGVLHHLEKVESEKYLQFISTHSRKNVRIIIIEAIPPIKKWNLPGFLLRYFDKGKFVRTRSDYKKMIEKKFRITENFLSTEVFFDYAVFLAVKGTGVRRSLK